MICGMTDENGDLAAEEAEPETPETPMSPGGLLQWYSIASGGIPDEAPRPRKKKKKKRSSSRSRQKLDVEAPPPPARAEVTRSPSPKPEPVLKDASSPASGGKSSMGSQVLETLRSGSLGRSGVARKPSFRDENHKMLHEIEIDDDMLDEADFRPTVFPKPANRFVMNPRLAASPGIDPRARKRRRASPARAG